MVTEGTKEQLILAIQSLNRSASEEFLRQFAECDLRDYLSSLQGNAVPRRTGTTMKTHQQEMVGVH